MKKYRNWPAATKNAEFQKRQNQSSLNNNSDIYEDLNQIRENGKLGRERNDVRNLDGDGDIFLGGINSIKILRGANGKL